jgi:hypothetical protein
MRLAIALQDFVPKGGIRALPADGEVQPYFTL